MDHKDVTCPETGNREAIDVEPTHVGLVVTGCTRFEAGCEPGCTRECARFIDVRDRGDQDWTERVLVTYASSDDGRTRAIAQILADDLKRDGLIVEVSDARLAPPPEDYDAVVIGSAIRFGRAARPAVRYIEEHREALNTMPAFWFSVSELAVVAPASDPDGCIRQLGRKTGWRPTDSVTFGAPDQDALVRRILTTLGRRRDDTAQWRDVHEFALRIADQVPAARLQQLAL
jgi:menaquinone-dependent protoporphyrinogen IX oxidase